MTSNRNNYDKQNKIFRYEDFLHTHERLLNYLMKYAKTEKIKYVAQNYLVPEIATMKFNLSARKNNLTEFMNLYQDENIIKDLKRAFKFFMLRHKPEIFFKAFIIYFFPEIYFKLRKW